MSKGNPYSTAAPDERGGVLAGEPTHNELHKIQAHGKGDEVRPERQLLGWSKRRAGAGQLRLQCAARCLCQRLEETEIGLGPGASRGRRRGSV